MMTWKLIAVLGATTLGLAATVVWQLVERARVRRRFAGVVELDRELARRRRGFAGELARRRSELAGVLGKTAALQHGYQTLVAAHAQLHAELTALEHTAEAHAVGLAPPSCAPGEAHDGGLREARAQQRELVQGDAAVAYGETWLLGGSRGEGARLQRQYARLLLRAFNGECEAAIARIGVSGLAQMAARITASFAAINRLGAVLQIQLTAAYHDAKLDELRLAHAIVDRGEAPLVRGVVLPAIEAPEPRPSDDHRLARGSIPIQLTPHARTVEPVERALAGRPVHPEPTVDKPAS